jgi:putative membrane protein insertion efficiency factor
MTLKRGLALIELALLQLLLLPVRLYRRFLSPVLPPACRFHPSCSKYALDALTTHGPFRGSWLAARRLSRCHPFHPGGLDPVPPPRAAAFSSARTRNG